MSERYLPSDVLRNKRLITADHRSAAEESLARARSASIDDHYHAAAAQTHALLAVADAVEHVVAALTPDLAVVDAEVHCQGCVCPPYAPTAEEIADGLLSAHEMIAEQRSPRDVFGKAVG